MAKKSILPGKANSYPWTFASIGGVTRVTINSGEDIAHLDELDQKLWTVLSCPVKGLEFDEQTLTLMDSDGDGKIRVNEVVATSKWLVSVLKDSDKLLAGDDQIAMAVNFLEFTRAWRFPEAQVGKFAGYSRDFLMRTGHGVDFVTLRDFITQALKQSGNQAIKQ